jgi:hypothetical protein
MKGPGYWKPEPKIQGLLSERQLAAASDLTLGALQFKRMPDETIDGGAAYGKMIEK